MTCYNIQHYFFAFIIVTIIVTNLASIGISLKIWISRRPQTVCSCVFYLKDYITPCQIRRFSLNIIRLKIWYLIKGPLTWKVKWQPMHSDKSWTLRLHCKILNLEFNPICMLYGSGIFTKNCLFVTTLNFIGIDNSIYWLPISVLFERSDLLFYRRLKSGHPV